MALNQLGAITLTQDYALASFSTTAFTNFTNWSTGAGTLVTQTSTDFTLSNALPSQAVIFVSPSFSPVITYLNGVNFKVSVTIECPGGTGSVDFQLGIQSSGSIVILSNTHTISAFAPPLSYDFTFDITDYSGLQFDRINIYGTPSNGDTYNNHLANITLITTDNFSAFNTGDRIISYWDDVGVSVVNKREDNPGGALTLITSGPVLPTLNINQITDIVNIPLWFFGVPYVGSTYRSGYQFCDSTNLEQFYFGPNGLVAPNYYPYVFQYETVDAIECAITPIVCDVHFTALPVITGASNSYASDGTVQLVATGSHGGCRYGTDPPTTTAGQFSNLVNTIGLFTGLAAGTYTFYAVDQYNCYAAITVIIPALDATGYSAKYRLRYYDVMSREQSIIDIQERQYSGDPIDVDGTGEPLVISKYNGELNNKFDVIRPTYATFSLNSQRHFQFIGLFSQDERAYKLSFTHSTSSWKGFIQPSVYSEQYSPTTNYPVNVKFGDGLASMADYEFTDDSGNAVITNQSVISLLSIILKKTGLDLDIVSCVNMYCDGMYSGASGDPLAQAYIEGLTFYDDEGVGLQCDVVLQEILKPFGAEIIQKDSAWNIIPVDSQITPYAYRRFNYAGVYQSNGTINPIKEIKNPSHTFTDVLFADSDHNLEIVPAYGQVNIEHTLKTRTSLFPLSLSTGWQANSYGSAGYASLFTKPDSRNNGMDFFNLTNDKMTFVSPFFDLTTFNDSLKISFSYLMKMQTYASFTDPFTSTTYNGLNVPDPPWIKIGWKLLLQYSSIDYYYHESIGWNRLDVIATSVSSVAIPTSHPTSKSLTITTGLTLNPGKTLKIQNDSTHYFRATVTSYNATTGALVVDSYANVGTGTFTAWDIYAAGEGFDTNYIFATEYNRDFQNVEKTLDLPAFNASTEVSIQLQFTIYGTLFQDFSSLTDLRAIPTAIYPEGFQIVGEDPANSYYLRWYKLRAGTDADNGTSIIRGNDYNGTSNAVVWDSDGNDRFNYVNVTNAVKFQDVIVKVLPNKQAPPEKETLTYNNDVNFKEKLDYVISVGDLPTTLVNKEIYLGVLRLSDGTPTTNWTRVDNSDNGSIQELLLNALNNQYRIPTWRLSGTFLAPDLKVTDIVKQIINAYPFSITNPEDPNGTGWYQGGSGQAWAGTSGYCSVNFSAILTGNSTYCIQPQSIISGARLEIEFSFLRMSTSGARTDRFVCIMLKNGSVTQKVTLYDGITGDITVTDTVEFDVDADADTIGFFIENISGTGTCEYRVDYFRGDGLAITKYYFANALGRSDKKNSYRAEFIELLPA